MTFPSLKSLLSDYLAGADFCALSAILALGIINVRNIVGNGNSLVGAVLCTDAAADAAYLADLADFAALCLGDAGDMGLLIGRNDSNDVSGTCVYALAASDTCIAVDNSLAVNNGDCIVGADLCAGAVAEAAECALEGTACDLESCIAIDCADIIILTGCIAAAGASDVCGLSDCFAGLNAHDSSDLLCNFSAAYGAGVYGSIACNDSFSKVCTACVSAAAAVSAGEALLNLRNALILLNGKDLGANCKQKTKQEAKNGEC